MAEEKKTTAVKAEVKEEVKKAPAKKAPAKKTVAKKAEAPAAKDTAAKAVKAVKKAEPKAAAKKAEKKVAAPKKTTAKASTKKAATTLFIQAGESEYTMEALEKIVKDRWQYDHNGAAADLKSIDVYVKLEERTVYYVCNGEITGSFFL